MDRSTYRQIMREVSAVFHRTKTVSIYPLGSDRFLVEAVLQDEIHDVHVEVEIVHPSLEIVAARSQVRNGPFTSVCDLTQPNMQRLVGMRVARGFTQQARRVVGGPGGCHRVSELLVEVAQAAYQLHFVRFFGERPPVIPSEDVPVERRQAVLQSIPGMRNTCFSYNEENDGLIAGSSPLRLRRQTMPRRELP
jgi:hypothetical protein